MKTFLRGILWLLIHAFERSLSIDNVKGMMTNLYKQIFFVKIFINFFYRLLKVFLKKLFC